MKNIMLNRGYFTQVDDSDFDWLSNFNWFVTIMNTGHTYAHAWVDGRSIFMHRLIMNAPKGILVDHKDNNGLNNCRSNLRLASHSQNHANTTGQARRKSKYKGVYTQKNSPKFRAKITVGSKKRHLGYYDTEEEAAEAYNKAALDTFGEFALLNIIP